MLEFKIGDKVVYPAHGVAEILTLEIKKIGKSKQKFYVLKILENNMIVMVPYGNVSQVGIRKIISSNEADEVFCVLKKREKNIESTTWNRRYREYMEKIKTGSAFEVAEVLRDLYLLKTDKELSFGERKMLDTANSLLVREISISKGISHHEVQIKLRSIFRI